MDDEIYWRVNNTLNKLVDFIYHPSETDTSSASESEEERFARVTAFRDAEEERFAARAALPLEGFGMPPSFTKRGVANSDHQDILRNMGMAREVLFHGVNIDFDIMKKINELSQVKMTPAHQKLTELSREWLFTTCKKTIFVLGAFTSSCPDNQAVLFSRLPLLRSKMGHGMFVWDVVISTFYQNQDLSEIVPLSLFSQFAGLLQKCKTYALKCRHCDFFLSLMQPLPSGRTIVRNQSMTMKVLTSPSVEGVLLTKLPATGAVLDEIISHDDEQILEYHTKSLKILAFCAKGRNASTGAKCQSMISLQQIAEELKELEDQNDNAGTRGLKIALLEVAKFVYIDTPLIEQASVESKEMWDVLTAAGNIVANVFDPDNFKKSHELVILAAFEVISVFFKDIWNEDISQTTHITNGRTLIKDIIEAFSRSLESRRSASSVGLRKSSITRRRSSVGSFSDDLSAPGNMSVVSIMAGKTLSYMSDGNESVASFNPAASALLAAEDEDDVDRPLTRDELKELMQTDFQGYYNAAIDLLSKSPRVSQALVKKDQEFVALMESCESLTDPDNPDYLEAATGISASSISTDDEKEKKGFVDYCRLYLDFLGGMQVLAVILLLTLGAVIITVLQLAVNLDDPAADVMDLVVSWVFIFELSTRMAAYMVVNGEMETFIFDPLNDVDIFVVAVDVFLLSNGGGRGGAGLVKSLRALRGFRLLRLFRATRMMRLLRLGKNKMTKESALNDARSVKVTFGALCKRILSYVERHHNSSEREPVVKQCLTFLAQVLEKAESEMESDEFTELELMSSTKSKIRDLREQKFKDCQQMLLEEGSMLVAVLTISNSDSLDVMNCALILGEALVRHHNTDAKEIFEKLINETDKDGLFFLSMRDRLRSSCSALVEYRATQEYNPTRAKEFLPEVNKCLLTLKFLTQLCEGHSLSIQNLLREQPGSAKTFNLVEEALELVSVQGKSLPVVRQMDDFEGGLTLCSLEFFVEILQGPCEMNQTFVATNRKLFDVCKNILSASLPNILDVGLRVKLYAASMGVLAALLESRVEYDIHHIIIEQIPCTLFGRRMMSAKTMLQDLRGKEGVVDEAEELIEITNGEIRDIYTLCGELESASKHKGSPKAFEQLDDILKALGGGEEEEEDGQEGGKGTWAEVEDGVRCVEVYWNDRTVKAFFTLPKCWQSFSESSKETFIGNADLGNSETRMKSLMEARQELYEEMQFQEKLSSYKAYRMLSANFFFFKKLTYGVVLLLNATVLLTTFDNFDSVSVAGELEDFSAEKQDGAITALVLAALCVVMYSFTTMYLAVSYAPLAYKRSKRAMQSYRSENPNAPLKDWGVMAQWIVILAFFGLLALLHSMEKRAYETGTYVSAMTNLFLVSLPFALRGLLIAPKSKILTAYCCMFDVLSDPPLRNNLLLTSFVFMGVWEPYWFTFALLDVLTMSETLQAVITSVTRPISHLTQTFALFIIVILCYTAVAFHLFGENSFVNEDGDPACFTLVDCFVYSVYFGMREGDFSAILSDHDEGGSRSEVNRIIFDLTFFVILGVLLFDMVTGVILDTFAGLREEIAERQELTKNETFVSGLRRHFIEELEGNAVDFNVVNEEDQNKWNYLFYAIYLDAKEGDEMNGYESYVRECLDKGDSGWIPTKTSWIIENLGVGADNEEEDLGAEIGELRNEIKSLGKKLEEVLRFVGSLAGDKME
jgi:hypothetical protein